MLIFLFCRCSSVLDDTFTQDAIFGVATGVNCGFLSTVSNIYKTQVRNRSIEMCSGWGYQIHIFAEKKI